MLNIYRPHVSPVMTSFCLSEKDLSLMKHTSRIVIRTICEMCEWLEPTKISESHHDDPFVQFYFNEGNPDLNFLIDYHYAMHLALKKLCGEKIDMLASYENYLKVFKEHRQDCMKVRWSANAVMLHRMYLLKCDYHWYKRHFKNYNVEEYFKNFKPELHSNGEIATGELR